MKKFKWPLSGKKKVIKRAPIDLSDFKDDLEPFVDRVRDVRTAYEFFKSRYVAAHRALWDKVAEIVGYELPGNWTFDFTNQVVTYTGDDAIEVVALAPSAFPSYEEHWKGLQATFYRSEEG